MLCSQAVTHPSTNRAQRCLTSVIGRELVRSTWYGRWREKGAFYRLKRQDPHSIPIDCLEKWTRVFEKCSNPSKMSAWLTIKTYSNRNWDLSSLRDEYVVVVCGKNGKKPTAPRVPRRSPIQVLTGLKVAWYMNLFTSILSYCKSATMRQN